MPYSHAVRTNRFYPFRGNGLLLRLPHLHGHKDSAGGSERQNAEKENHTEEEIDISDEAKSFRPTRVSRDEEKKEDAAGGKQEETPAGATSNFRRPGYREAIMTDGILVDDLIHEIDRLAETGTGDLGLVIYTCENAR